MLNYTPDFKPSRKSTIGVAMTTPGSASFSGSVSIRRRYSLAVDASISLSVNGTASEKQTPNINGVAVAGRSLSQPVPGTPGGNKRMSVHENLMMKILSTPVDQPLAANDSDSSSSDVSFSSSRVEAEISLLTAEQLVESDVLLRCTTPPNALIENNPRLARLYRDLQSPSATTRLRALRALKSPSKREAYGQFDVPHEEQDIITAEERAASTSKTIQEIMTGVCIYVEVRSGADNRSDGIKDHVASLGAKVNEKLYKDTTHVIFKDGLLSTYQKAKKKNIPVVSILWIEACKRHICLMNPDSYPISNKERYENPELFKKIRRPKSMQPRAEEAVGSGGKKRPPLKAANSGDNNPGAGSYKAVVSPPTKLPVLHRLRKDDGLERILDEFQAENENTPEPQDDFDRLLAGPMRLLERFRNSPVVASAEKEKEKEEEGTPEVPMKNIRKSLFNGSAEKETTPTGRRRRSTSASKDVSVMVPTTRQRRKAMLFTPRITSVEEERESPVSGQKPGDKKRKTMSVSSAKENTPPRKTDTICSPKAMELCKANSADVQENVPPPSSQKVRNTIYSPKGMEQSSEKTERVTRVEVVANSRRTLCPSTTANVDDSGVSHKTKTPEMDAKDLEAFRTNRRRTLYTPGVYDQSDQQPKAPVKTPVINRRSTLFNPAANSTATTNITPANVSSAHSRRTLYTPSASLDVPETPNNSSTNRRRTIFATPNPNPTPRKTLVPMATPTSNAQKRNKTLLEEYQSSLTFSSTRTPVSERRKTIFDISMDIIDQRLSHINKQSKQPEPTDESKSEHVLLSVLKSPPPLSSPGIIRQTSMDSFYRKQSRSTEKTIKFKTSSEVREATGTNPIATISRKRKLFNAQPSIAETPPRSNVDGSQHSDPISLSENPTKRPKTVVGSATTPAAPKRRSLAPTTSAAPKSAKSDTLAASRRSSMFFSQPTVVSKPVSAPRPVMGTQARTMKALGLGAGLPTVASQHVAKTGKPQFQLATTNLHAAQHAFVKEVRSQQV